MRSSDFMAGSLSWLICCLDLLKLLLAVGHTVHQNLLLADTQLAGQFLYLILANYESVFKK